MRVIPKKNYFILVVIIVATLFSVFFIREKYLKQISYDRVTNKRIDFIFEIKEKELDSYLMENREVVIYMASSADNSLENFETELKKYVLKEQLGKELIYINLNDISKNFLNKLKTKYFSEELKNNKIELINDPNMMIVENGKIVSIMYNKEKTINMEDVKKYLTKYVEDTL